MSGMRVRIFFLWHLKHRSTSPPPLSGLAEVTETGEGVSTLVPGDRVVMVKPQAGTWSTNESVLENEIIKIPSSGGKTISDVQGATMTVRD